MKKEKNNPEASCRLNKVGGQAVLEGVMMKAGSHAVTTCRKEDGTLVVTDDSFTSIRKKYKILNLPLLRGVVNFIEMMALSVKTLGASADAMGLDEEENPGKVEKWLSTKLGISVTDIVMVISVILGLGLSVFLFLFLPIWLTAGINALLGLLSLPVMNPVLTAIIEGLVKMGVFIVYLALVSLMPDIKRTFMYHGAEHKSIACFESGEELTPANAMKHKRFHPRCGTSFMFFMILIGIFAGVIIKTLIPGLETWAYTLIRLLILPLVMGIGYEIIMFAGKHDNVVTRALSAPGLWVQRITTKEPTEDMLEVAIISLKCALRDEFDEFRLFFEERSWEPKTEENSDAAASSCEGDASTSSCENDADIAANSCEGDTDTDADTCKNDEDKSVLSAEKISDSETASSDINSKNNDICKDNFTFISNNQDEFSTSEKPADAIIDDTSSVGNTENTCD